jgi:methylenetetrahydrofolate reductase (NADPH)
MMAASVSVSNPVCEILNNYSIEMTAKDVANLEQAADVTPQGTKIPVTSLPGGNFRNADRRGETGA